MIDWFNFFKQNSIPMLYGFWYSDWIDDITGNVVIKGGFGLNNPPSLEGQRKKKSHNYLKKNHPQTSLSSSLLLRTFLDPPLTGFWNSNFRFKSKLLHWDVRTVHLIKMNGRISTFIFDFQMASSNGGKKLLVVTGTSNIFSIFHFATSGLAGT